MKSSASCRRKGGDKGAVMWAAPEVLGEVEHIQKRLADGTLQAQGGLLVSLSKGAVVLGATRLPWASAEDLVAAAASPALFLSHQAALEEALPGGCRVSGLYYATWHSNGASRQETEALAELCRRAALRHIVCITAGGTAPRLQPCDGQLIAVKAFFPLEMAFSWTGTDQQLDLLLDSFRVSLSGDGVVAEFCGKMMSLEDPLSFSSSSSSSSFERFPTLHFWTAQQPIPQNPHHQNQEQQQLRGVVCTVALGLSDNSTVQQFLDSLLSDLRSTLRWRLKLISNSDSTAAPFHILRSIFRPPLFPLVPMSLYSSSLSSPASLSSQLTDRLSLLFQSDRSLLSDDSLLHLESFSQDPSDNNSSISSSSSSSSISSSISPISPISPISSAFSFWMMLFIVIVAWMIYRLML